jgi:hypothetical protein
MAFIKSTPLPNGTVGNYWKITRSEINFLARTAQINFGLLASKEFNDSNYEATEDRRKLLIGDEKVIHFSSDDFPFTKEALEGNDIKAVAYSACKAKETFFADATDDV